MPKGTSGPQNLRPRRRLRTLSGFGAPVSLGEVRRGYGRRRLGRCRGERYGAAHANAQRRNATGSCRFGLQGKHASGATNVSSALPFPGPHAGAESRLVGPEHGTVIQPADDGQPSCVQHGNSRQVLRYKHSKGLCEGLAGRHGWYLSSRGANRNVKGIVAYRLFNLPVDDGPQIVAALVDDRKCIAPAARKAPHHIAERLVRAQWLRDRLHGLADRDRAPSDFPFDRARDRRPDA